MRDTGAVSRQAADTRAGKTRDRLLTPAARLTCRFALLPALAVVALTAVMLGAGYRLLSQEFLERALVRNQQRADVLGQQLQQSLHDAVDQTRLIARSPLLQPGSPLVRTRAELEHLVDRSPRFVWVGRVARDGQVLAGSRGWLEGQSLAQRAVFQLGQEKRGDRVGDLHRAVLLAPMLTTLPGGTSELIDIAEPVLNESGEVVAIVAAHLGLHWVQEPMTLSLGDPRDTADADLKALVLTQMGDRSVLPGTALPAGLPAALGPAQPWQAPDGERWLLAQSALRGTGGETPLLPWRAVVLQREALALAPLRDLAGTMLGVGIATALLLGAAGFWASRRLLTPWDPVFDAVLAGDSGNDPARVAARVQALVAQREQPTPTERLMGWLARDASNLRRALDHLPVAVALADRHCRCEYVNPAYTRLLGWTTDASAHRPVGATLLEPGERDAWARLHQQLEAEPGEFVSRLEALTPSGQRVAVQLHLVPMFDGHGRQMGVLGIVNDIRAERSARMRADAMSDRLRALAEAAVDTLLATLDIDGHVLEWSPGAEQLTGHPPAHALGRTLDTLLPGNDTGAWLRRAQIDGRCAMAVQAGGADGHARRFEGSAYRLQLAPGPACFGIILRDAGSRPAAPASPPLQAATP